MKVYEIINENETIMEVPLPSEWDKSVYTPKTSYKKRIDYAVARAQKIGRGSSRSAFIIPYEGRQTILKVAHNKKGMAQNEAEASILDDGYAKNMGILIPLIDYDEEHTQPVWIHTELAQKATEEQLCSILKCPRLVDLVRHANMIGSGKNASQFQAALKSTLSDDDFETFLEYSDKLTDLSNSFDIKLVDFSRAANWGLFNNEPVLIDLGFTSNVQQLYYK